VISELGVDELVNGGIEVDVVGFHVSFLKPIDFIVNPPSIVHTLFREGYSLKRDKAFSEIYKFSNRVLFRYELVGLSASLKVKIVNLLRGKSGGNGMIEENNGEWISNQVFTVPVGNEHLFERFFVNFKIKYKKFYVLMH